MRYETLKDLKAAYDSGELTGDTPLVLDNDCTFVYVDGECVYRTDYRDLTEALDLLSIPWSPC